MNKFILLLILMGSGSTCLSQTMDETMDYITRVSQGREQVMYDKNKNIFMLISVRESGGLISFVKEINPEEVNSVTVRNGNDGWNSINLNFKSGGSDVYDYTVDKNFDLLDEVEKNHQYGVNISIPADENQIKKFQKAYIHLFKLLGVEVSDGEMF